MSDPAPTDCPVCGAPKLSKQISAAAFRLKGSGWYETDFKSGDKRNLASDSGEVQPAAVTKGAPAAKGEAKPEAKADTKADAKPAAKADAAAPAKTEAKPAPAAAPSSGAAPAAG